MNTDLGIDIGDLVLVHKREQYLYVSLSIETERHNDSQMDIIGWQYIDGTRSITFGWCFAESWRHETGSECIQVSVD